jgi:hypothetical protein
MAKRTRGGADGTIGTIRIKAIDLNTLLRIGAAQAGAKTSRGTGITQR